LEAAGDPLTDEQIVLLKEIEGGIEAHDERMAILTTSQVEILEAHRAERWPEADAQVPSGDESLDSVEKALAVENGPEAFSVLKQNYPNPFNPVTSIEYQLAAAGNVRVDIYGPSGQLVDTLADEYQSAGQHSLVWNASSHASGIYLCKITSGEFTSSVKMTYVK
ncbi:T9SS type A sorting domain-containing protein, partial [Candidatus Latescibacterota bacterium]